MKQYLVQKIRISGTPLQGPLQGPGGSQIETLADLINVITSFVVPFALVILFFVFVSGGYDFLFSRGNPEKVKSARAKLTAGVVGFILLVMSYLIVRLVSQIFGIGEGLF